MNPAEMLKDFNPNEFIQQQFQILYDQMVKVIDLIDNDDRLYSEYRKKLWFMHLKIDNLISFTQVAAPFQTEVKVIGEGNHLLTTPIKQLDRMEDIISDFMRETYRSVDERVDSPLFAVQHGLSSIRSYLSMLTVEKPPEVYEKLCRDCEKAEAAPGLDCCGPCYGKRIGRT